MTTVAQDRVEQDRVARGARQGKRIAVIFVVAFTFLFIGASAWQIVPAIFGAWVRPLPASAQGTPARTCAEGIARLAKALDRSADAVGSTSFTTSLQPEWNDRDAIESACRTAPGGLDAWAALARLRSAQEQLARSMPGSHAEELGPLRRDVSAHLPADLR